MTDIERGNQFEDEAGNKFWWKNCTSPECTHYVCRGYSEDFCYQHLPFDARAKKDADMAAGN